MTAAAPALEANSTLALECRDVCVNYGEVAALVDVSVGFAPHLIHAVVGQNGAGKTTFARVAAGIVQPDTGEVVIGGDAVPTGNVHRARAAGVELVHQSFALPPSFTIAEAMEFGNAGAGGVYTRQGLESRWAKHLEGLGLRLRLRDRIRDLPVETQQGIEIARALVTDAKVLILDEPTAVLSPGGVEILFERLRRLRQGGVTIILILHKIREVLAIADSVTVLRGGHKIEGPLPTRDVNARRLARSIIGAGAEDVADLSGKDRAALVGEALAEAPTDVSKPQAAPPILSVAQLTTRADAEGPRLDDVSFTVGKGEIVGVAGVEGNGQRTLVRALAALTSLTAGTIALAGTDITNTPLSGRRGRGLRLIPFERNMEGLSLSSPLWQNWSVPQLLSGSALRLIDPAGLRSACHAALQRWGVRFASTEQRAGSLSGGNAQKIILAREVDAEALLIIAAQPTRGLDVGATSFVWRSLREARARGCGVLLISSDLDELFDISDRILVMLSGRIAGEFEPPYRLADIGAAMTGAVA